MNRLQKKCFVAAAGFHLLLLLILFVGPAFLPSNKGDNLPPIDFVPWKTVDALISGGGNPTAPPPQTAPTPTPPAPQTVVQPPPTPQPPKIEVKETVKTEPIKQIEKPEPPKNNKPDPDAVEAPKPTKRKIEVNTTIVKRNTDDIKAAAKAAADAARAKELANAKRRATEISKALSGLKGDLSPSTTITMIGGPGGGGVPYANWLQAVKSLYSNAWTVPESITDDSAVTTVSVTIARDGTVLSARIISPSGNAVVDHSVRTVLDRVKNAPPLPDTAKEEQRTVNITFDVKAKLLG
jgi:TonB family protein